MIFIIVNGIIALAVIFGLTYWHEKALERPSRQSGKKTP